MFQTVDKLLKFESAYSLFSFKIDLLDNKVKDKAKTTLKGKGE